VGGRTRYHLAADSKMCRNVAGTLQGTLVRILQNCKERSATAAATSAFTEIYVCHRLGYDSSILILLVIRWLLAFRQNTPHIHTIASWVTFNQVDDSRKHIHTRWPVQHSSAQFTPLEIRRHLDLFWATPCKAQAGRTQK
jgi:hypothetical protein